MNMQVYDIYHGYVSCVFWDCPPADEDLFGVGGETFHNAVGVKKNGQQLNRRHGYFDSRIIGECCACVPAMYEHNMTCHSHDWPSLMENVVVYNYILCQLKKNTMIDYKLGLMITILGSVPLMQTTHVIGNM